MFLLNAMLTKIQLIFQIIVIMVLPFLIDADSVISKDCIVFLVFKNYFSPFSIFSILKVRDVKNDPTTCNFSTWMGHTCVFIFHDAIYIHTYFNKASSSLIHLYQVKFEVINTYQINVIYQPE